MVFMCMQSQRHLGVKNELNPTVNEQTMDIIYPCLNKREMRNQSPHNVLIPTADLKPYFSSRIDRTYLRVVTEEVWLMWWD